MKKRSLKIVCISLAALLICGCYGYRAYMGLHGKSIRLHPDAHESSFMEDSECLDCHHPDNAIGPPTPHPDFTGCIHCHNDEVEAAEG